jgi:hypothetical protein
MIPSTGDFRVIQEGSKKLMTSAKKRVSKINPHLKYTIFISMSNKIGDIIRGRITT